MTTRPLPGHYHRHCHCRCRYPSCRPLASLRVSVPAGLVLEATNAVPHGRGMGSSATAIVSGVAAAQGLSVCAQAAGDGLAGVPGEVLDRLAEIGILTPNSKGYSPSDIAIIEAMSRFRAGGYDEQTGFTVYDTLRYKRALEALVKEEVDVLVERLKGQMPPDRAVALIESGAEPLRDFIAALHTKLMVEEVERRR